MRHFAEKNKKNCIFATNFAQKLNILENKINSKMPHECTCIEDVRYEIDSIDREIIQLLATRLGYVREVVKYKENTHKAIEANDRRLAVLNTRREWAEEQGLNPDVVESIYDALIKYFIEEEKKLI